MKKPGRPNVELGDRPMLVEMAERWCAGKSSLSIRKVSRIVVGLEAASSTSKPKYSLEDDARMKPKPSSTAKRLERRFMDLNKSDMAVPLSVYRVREQERKRAMKARGAVTYGAFYEDNQTDPTFISAEMEAIHWTAVRCKIVENDVTSLALTGLNILREWFPHDYSISRI